MPGRGAPPIPKERRTCEACGLLYLPTGLRQRWCVICVPNRTAIRRLQRYGLTQPQWQALYAEQGGHCALCEAPPMAVDHDHATGRVRGLLCHRCNLALVVLERGEWVDRAKRYLGHAVEE